MQYMLQYTVYTFNAKNIHYAYIYTYLEITLFAKNKLVETKKIYSIWSATTERRALQHCSYTAHTTQMKIYSSIKSKISANKSKWMVSLPLDVAALSCGIYLRWFIWNYHQIPNCVIESLLVLRSMLLLLLWLLLLVLAAAPSCNEFSACIFFSIYTPVEQCQRYTFHLFQSPIWVSRTATSSNFPLE